MPLEGKELGGDEDAVKLIWEGSDREAVKWLLVSICRLFGCASTQLDEGHYTFTDGVTSTFCNTASSVIGTKLQHLWVSQSKRDSLKFALTQTCHRLLLHRDFSDA